MTETARELFRAPLCSMPGCDHSRTVPDDETPDQRQARGAAWVGAGGTAICWCHPVIDVAAQFGDLPATVDGWATIPPERFPCDEKGETIAALLSAEPYRWCGAYVGGDPVNGCETEAEPGSDFCHEHQMPEPDDACTCGHPDCGAC